MYKLINQNVDAVIDAAEDLGIAAYAELRADLDSLDPSTDTSFQKRYRNYWRMNVGRFGPAFYARYFELLATSHRAASADIRHAIKSLSELGAESRGLQFSFASKLVHMVDPRIPVYDAYVAAFYFYNPLKSKTPRPNRIKDLLAFHDFLTSEYSRIIRYNLLREAIVEFRRRHVRSAEIPDERIIDWLLWGWVAYLRSGAQRGGQALYS